MKKLSLKKVSLTALDAVETKKVAGGRYTMDEFNPCYVSSPMESDCVPYTQNCPSATCPPYETQWCYSRNTCDSFCQCFPIE
jgi:hypothetical protein